MVGETMLDIGCGYGGQLAVSLESRPATRVVGWTHSANQVREGLQLLLTQPAVFTGYVERGLKHIQLYNADHVANLYNELYQRMINE